MLESREYVAIQDFSINLDGKNPTYLKRGETLTFDGLNVSVRGEKGTARALSKVIGEWISPVSAPAVTPAKKLASASRNATGGRVVEHSDYPSDPVSNVKNPPSDSVETLLKTYERTPEVKLVNGKREVTSDLDDARREVQLINDDANEVRKVTAVDGAPVTNKSGVELKGSVEGKKAVLSTEGQIAKNTNYSGKVASESGVKKLSIDYEASGVEVRKTSAKSPAVVKKAAKMETVETDVEVAQIAHPSKQTTDVGSSTQAQIEQRKEVQKAPVKKAPAKKVPAKKAPVKKAPVKKTPVKSAPVKESEAIDEDFINSVVNNAEEIPVAKTNAPAAARGPVVNADGQEAVVVGKITRDSNSRVMTEDGIVSKVTVGGSSDMDAGDVQFSSNNDLEVPEATFGSGEDTAYDALGADEAQVIDSDDLDINDLLSDV